MYRGSPPLIPPTASSTFICAEGDSITQNLATGIITYPIKYAPDTSLVTLIDKAHAGDQLSAVSARQTADIALIASNPGFSTYIYTLLIGYNDANNPTYYPNNAAQYAVDIGTLCDSIRAGGYTIVLASTLTSFGGFDLTKETWRAQVNAGIVGLYPTHVDGIMDYANASPMGPPGASLNRSLLLEGLHPTNLGQIYIERLYALTVNSIIAGAVAPSAPNNLLAVFTKPTGIMLTWDYPTSGGYCSSFSLQYRVSGTTNWTTFTPAAANVKATNAYISGLTANTTYDLQVAAVGPYGTSAYTQTAYKTPASLANTFDPNTHSGGTFLSSDNLTATGQQEGYSNLVKTNIGKSSGKWYTELNAVSGGAIIIGLCDDTFIVLPNYIDMGVFTNSASTGSGDTVTGFTKVNTGLLDVEPGNTIMFAFDADAKQAWVGRNGTWTSSGAPASGTNPWVTWSDNYTIYICVAVNYNGDSIQYLGGGTPTYTPPSGFSVLA